VVRAEESARFNVRGKQTRVAQPRLRSTLTGLERCHLTLRTVARAVLDRTYFTPIGKQDAAYTVEQRATLADVLTAAASAIDSVVPIAEVESAAVARGRVEAHLADLYEHRDRLNALLAVDSQVDQAAWKQHGALLASIDRLAVEVQSAAREPDTEWRPDSIAARPREAVRRIVDAATARRARPDHTARRARAMMIRDHCDCPHVRPHTPPRLRSCSAVEVPVCGCGCRELRQVVRLARTRVRARRAASRVGAENLVRR
jgi:hypothetical protein